MIVRSERPEMQEVSDPRRINVKPKRLFVSGALTFIGWGGVFAGMVTDLSAWATWIFVAITYVGGIWLLYEAPFNDRPEKTRLLLSVVAGVLFVTAGVAFMWWLGFVRLY